MLSKIDNAKTAAGEFVDKVVGFFDVAFMGVDKPPLLFRSLHLSELDIAINNYLNNPFSQYFLLSLFAN